MKRLERLNALASSVPYYSTINAIQPNITKTTKARMNDVFVPYCDYNDGNYLKEFQQGTRKLTSFTNEHLFQDAKFRLANALHQSGIANSAYSRVVVKRLIPRTTERTTGIEPF